MQGMKFSHTIHVPGTLSANLDIRFTAPADCELVHVSAVASNDSDATLAIGISTDTDGFLEATAIGDSQVPTEFDLDDFDGAELDDAGSEYPRIDDGDTVVITLDYDGSSGTAADDVTIVLTFTEG
jgi:hypothetical protein